MDTCIGKIYARDAYVRDFKPKALARLRITNHCLLLGLMGLNFALMGHVSY